jgi:diacylglycerol kinase family enzyme
MDVVLLHNPSAGNEDHSRAQLERLLKRHGHSSRYADVRRGLRDDQLLESGDCVVVAGGDGTVRKALIRLAGRKRPAAILPAGTANNIARGLGVAGTFDEIVDGWRNASPSKMDLGIAEGPWGRVRFVEAFGFGLVGRTMAILGEIDHASAREVADTDEKLYRDMCVMAALAHEVEPIRARIGLRKEKTKDDFLLLEIMNIARAGPGLELAPDADPCDGWLNLVSVSAAERPQLVRGIQRHLAHRDRPHQMPSKPLRNARLSIDPCELRIDDRVELRTEDIRKLPGGRAKVDISVDRGAVLVLAPHARRRA